MLETTNHGNAVKSLIGEIERADHRNNDAEVNAFEIPKTNSPAEQWTMECECTNVGKIIAALKADPRFIDNHNGKVVEIGSADSWCDGVLLLTRENGYCAVCPSAISNYYCVNPLIIGADGRAHLSTTSVGGRVDFMDIDKYNQEHTREFLDSHHGSWLKAETLSRINL